MGYIRIETNGTSADELWYLIGARYYDPGIGRWASIDPKLDDLSRGLSPYVYCLSNPVNMIDPDGRGVIAAFASFALTGNNAVEYFSNPDLNLSYAQSLTAVLTSASISAVAALPSPDLPGIFFLGVFEGAGLETTKQLFSNGGWPSFDDIMNLDFKKIGENALTYGATAGFSQKAMSGIIPRNYRYDQQIEDIGSIALSAIIGPDQYPTEDFASSLLNNLIKNSGATSDALKQNEQKPKYYENMRDDPFYDPMNDYIDRR